MARSKIIREYKNKIISELSQDDEIIRGLGLNDGESEDDLIWVRLMPHRYVPNTQESVKSYITVEINIPQSVNKINQAAFAFCQKLTDVY